jgi:DNA-binding transcriptional LysR family regulator
MADSFGRLREWILRRPAGRERMNFHHLEYAVSVAKAGSIRKASQKLYMSQPYLSSMIKGLEEELGYRIFSRTAAGIVITREGEEFIKSAKIILLELKKIREMNMDEEEGQLNISCYYASLVMEKFLKFHNASAYKFSDKIKEMGSKDVLESVASGDSAVGIVFFAREKRRNYMKMISELNLFAAEFLKPMQVYAFMSRTHPLAGMSGVKVENLNDYPYVTYNDECSKNYLDVLGIGEHPQLLEVSDRGSFYDVLRSGEYLTSMAYRKQPESGEFVIIPFEDKDMVICSVYVTAKNYQLSKREKDFIEFVREGEVHGSGNSKKS